MTLFEVIYQRAVAGHPEPQLGPVITKELFHHEILRLLSEEGFLNSLTFVGGTCLRLCYGSVRYSEDLDFTAGPKFDPGDFSDLPVKIRDGLFRKYGLEVEVTPPKAERTANVDTWNICITTQPENKSVLRQRINLDVALTSSLTREPRLMTNQYQIPLGTEGLVLPVQALGEIYADKMVAFGNRPKVKYRDVWDMAWLSSKPPGGKVFGLVLEKLKERQISPDSFLSRSRNNLIFLRDHFRDYQKEMERFLPRRTLQMSQPQDYHLFISNLIENNLLEFKRELYP